MVVCSLFSEASERLNARSSTLLFNPFKARDKPGMKRESFERQLVIHAHSEKSLMIEDQNRRSNFRDGVMEELKIQKIKIASGKTRIVLFLRVNMHGQTYTFLL